MEKKSLLARSYYLHAMRSSKKRKTTLELVKLKNKKKGSEEYLGYSTLIRHLGCTCLINQMCSAVGTVDFFAFRNFQVPLNACFLLFTAVAITRNHFL